MERNVDLLKSQFDIDREPFSDDGVTGLFYPGAGRQQLLEQLLHLVRYGPPLLFLTGMEGCGKSFLARQLSRQLDSSIFRCVEIEASVLMDERSLMSSINEGFGLQITPEKETFVSGVMRFAAESDSYSQTALVLIDNVQNLSEAAVDIIASTVSAYKDSGLRFLMLVDADSVDQEPVLSQLSALVPTLGQVLTLPALTEPDVAEYLSYRMRTAGLDAVRFSPLQIKQIFAEFGGSIAQLNQYARETLVRQVPLPVEGKKQVLSIWHVLIVAMISVGIVALLYNEHDEGITSIASTSSDAPGTIVQRAIAQRESDADSLVYVETNVAPAHQEEVDLNFGNTAGDTVGDTVVESNLVAAAVDSQAEEVFQPRVVAAVNSVEDFNAEEDVFSSGGSAKNALDVVEVFEPKKAQPAPVQKAAIKASDNVELALAASKPKPEVNENPAAVIDDVPVDTLIGVPIEAAVVAPIKGYSPRESWLLSLDPKRYTLQMIGARDEPAVRLFISRYPSLKEVAYYRTLYKGKPWFVVVYGQFGSKQAAKQAVELLPKKLATSKPWTRQLAQVQRDIRKAR
ncbi:MAG: hypothetical protein COA99_00120 [Moraxellaceae bacterium]|nr:MAG: hypothetical protein COA99_00120 [Moraxellaceae bacterium]